MEGRPGEREQIHAYPIIHHTLLGNAREFRIHLRERTGNVHALG
jgi:hypothetical protein